MKTNASLIFKLTGYALLAPYVKDVTDLLVDQERCFAVQILDQNDMISCPFVFIDWVLREDDTNLLQDKACESLFS